MTRIYTYTSGGDEPHQINDRMTARFVKTEGALKGTGRGFLGLVQVIVGFVYPLFKTIGAILPLPIAGLKRRCIWLKEAGRGLSYIGHGIANIGVGLASVIPYVNAKRFNHIEYKFETENEKLRQDQDWLLQGNEDPEPKQEEFLYNSPDSPKYL